MTEMLKGIAASDGVAVAKAYLLVQPDLSFETASVEDTNAEEARLDVALEASQNELSVIREKAVESLGEEAAAVFDAHLMVLADPEMTGQIRETIRAKQVNAEAALTEVTNMFIAIFEGMEDNPYMQERAADIRDVTKRVLANLLGKKLPNPATIDEESIVVAHDLTPSDTAQLNKKFVKAFVTNIGGRTSHSAIMARTLEIAAVLGTNNITELVKDGDVLAVSGITGEVVINPTEEQIAEFKAAGEAYAKQKAEWALLKDAKTVTADGKHFELAANIGTPKDVEGVNDNGAEAVGLYRTEFLYMDSQDFPTDVLTAAFKQDANAVSDVVTVSNSSTGAATYYIVKTVSKSEKNADWKNYKDDLTKVIINGKKADTNFTNSVIAKVLKKYNVKVVDKAFSAILDQYATGSGASSSSISSSSK